MDDTQIVDWLEKNGEEIFTVRIKETDYLVLQWNDENGESQRTYGCDLRDAVRGALAGEGMPGQKLETANFEVTGLAPGERIKHGNDAYCARSG